MENQNNKKRASKYIKDEIALAYLRKNTDIIKIEESDGLFEVEYKDGTAAMFIKLVNGSCGHPFAVIGQGYDGKYYYACDTGGSCKYKRKLTEQEVKELIGEPKKETNKYNHSF